MKTQKVIKTKKMYTTPELNQIILDNEISLVLRSDPSDPGSGNSLQPEDIEIQNDPYKVAE